MTKRKVRSNDVDGGLLKRFYPSKIFTISNKRRPVFSDEKIHNWLLSFQVLDRKRVMAVCLWVALLALVLPGQKAGETATANSFSTCTDGPQPSGAIYRICMPTQGSWNGDLLVYAHGYVAFNEPVGIPEDQVTLPNGISLPEIVNEIGFAFAMSSYRVNGLAVVPGIEDLIEVVDIFTAQHGIPNHVYLVGASEGGLITTLAIEKHPDVFDGGMAVCGPIGDFSDQVNYLGDVRIIFDYYFPGLLPQSPILIPDWLIDGWDTYYRAVVQPNVFVPANQLKIDSFFDVTGASYDFSDPESKEEVTEGLLWYNVFATNDGIEKLGGQPFGNRGRWYQGSENDTDLNNWVQRFESDQLALDEINAHYQTSGDLGIPLVTLHTTGDPIVPYWHAEMYRGKVILSESLGLHRHYRIERFGHCQFEALEVLNGLAELIQMVLNPPEPEPTFRIYLPYSG